MPSRSRSELEQVQVKINNQNPPNKMQTTSPSEAKPSRYRSVRKQQQQKQNKENEAEAEEASQSPPPVPLEANTIARSRSRYHRPGTTTQVQVQTKDGSEDQPSLPTPVSPHAEHEQQDPMTTTSSPVRRPTTREGRASRYHHGAAARDSRSQTTTMAEEGGGAERNGRPSPRQPVPERGQLFPPFMPNKEGPARAEYDSDDDIRGGCFGLLKRKRNKDFAQLQTSEKVAASRNRRPVPGHPYASSEMPSTIRPGGGGVVPGTDAPVSAINSGERRVMIECGKSSRMLFPVTPETTPTELIQAAANAFSEPIDKRTWILVEYYASVGVQRPLRRYEHVRDVMNSWDSDMANTFLLVPARYAEVNPSTLSAGSVPQARPHEQVFQLSYSQKPGSWDKRIVTLHQDGQISVQKNAKDAAQNVCHLSDFDIYMPTAKSTTKKIKPPKKYCYAVKSMQKTSMFESHADFVHFFCTAEHEVGQRFFDAVQGWRSWYLVNVMGEGNKYPNAPGAIESPAGRSDSASAGAPAPAPAPARSMSKRAAGHSHEFAAASVGSRYQIGGYMPPDLDLSGDDARPGSSGSAIAHGSPRRTQSTREHHAQSSPRRMYSTREPIGHSSPSRTRSTREPPAAQVSPSRTRSARVPRTTAPLLDEDEPLGNLVTSPIVHAEPVSVPLVARQVSIKRTGSQRQANGSLGDPGLGLHRRPSTRDSVSPNTGAHVVDINRTASVKRSSSNGNGALVSPFSATAGAVPPVTGLPGIKPLIDLTPQYKPPPQFDNSKKGKGYHPTTIGPGGLIDSATTPEGQDAWNLAPAAYDWRGRSIGASAQHQQHHHTHTKSSPSAAAAGSGSARSRSRSSRAHQGRVREVGAPTAAALVESAGYYRSNNREGAVDEYASTANAGPAFTGSGLLAAAGAGTMTRGNSVRRPDGRHNGVSGEASGANSGAVNAPLLDMSEQSRFAAGSLLAKVEREEELGLGRLPS